MPELYFKIGADYEKVRMLTKDIGDLEKKLVKLDKEADPRIVKDLEEQLAETRKEFERITDDAARAAEEIKDFSTEAKSSESSLGGMASTLKGIGATMAGFFAVDSLQNFVSQVVSTRGEMQQLEVSFKTMLGSEEAANRLLDQLVQTAATTPFDLKGVADGAKSLLAYGTEASEVNETLVRLGDIAAGLSIPLGDMTYLFGTTMTQGRMYSQDLQQFLGRGIPIAAELAKQFNVAESEVKQLVSEGVVGAEHVKKAIWAMTDEGGRFGGLMEAQSKTINGQIANLEDALAMMYNEIGKASEGAISAAISGAASLVENYDKVAWALGSLITSYGGLKAAMMGIAAVKNNIARLSYEAEFEELKKLIPKKEEAINQDLEEALAKGRLTKEQADVIANMRKEAQAHVELQRLAASAAAQEAALAAKKAETAKAELDAHTAMLNELKAQERAAKKAGDVDTAASFQKERKAYAAKQAALASKHETLAAEAATAATKANTAQTAADTAAAAYNTAATTAQTAAKTAAAKATLFFGNALKKLKAAILSNPIGLISVAVAALVSVIHECVTAESSLEKAQKSMNEEFAKAEAEAMREQRAMENLHTKLDTLTEGTDEYNRTKEQLIAMAEKYNSELAEEMRTVGITADAYDRLAASIRRKAMEQGHAAALEKQQQAYGENLAGYLEKLQKKMKDIYADEEEANNAYRTLVNAVNSGDFFFSTETVKTGGGGSMGGSLDITVKKLNSKNEEVAKVLKKFVGGTKNIEDLLNLNKENEEALRSIDARFNTTAPKTEDQKQAEQDLRRTAENRFKAAAKAYAAAIYGADAQKLQQTKQEYYDALALLQPAGIKRDEIETYAQAKAVALQSFREAQKAYSDAVASDKTKSEVDTLAQALKKAKEEYDKYFDSKKGTQAAKKVEVAIPVRLDLTQSDIGRGIDSAVLAKLNHDTLAQALRPTLNTDPFEEFNRRRLDIEADYRNRRIDAERDGAAAIIALEKQRSDAIAALNREETDYMTRYSAVLAHAFQDVEQQTRDGLKRTIATLSRLKEHALDGTTDVEGITARQADGILQNPELLAQALQQLQDAQDKLAASSPFAAMLQGLNDIVEGSNDAAKDLSHLSEEQAKVYRQAAQNRLNKGARLFTSSLSDASSHVSTIADTLGKLSNISPDMERLAQTMSEVGTVLGDAASYAASGAQMGGGWGALIGAVAGLGVGFASIYERSAAIAKENEGNLQEYAKRVRQLSLELSDDYETLFGTRSIQRAADAYAKAKDALKDYVDFVNAQQSERAAQEAANIAGMFSGHDTLSEQLRNAELSLLNKAERQREENMSRFSSMSLKDYKAWIDGSTSSLRSIDGVQTSFSKWYKIGSRNKFNALGEYDLWNADGGLDIDKARAFLETQTNITEQAREQLQAAIDMTDQYNKMVDILDKEVSTYFGSWASDITDSIYDSIYNGSDAWDAFHAKATETIADIGKQLANQLIVQEYLNQYQDKLRDAFAVSDNGASVMAVTDEMVSGMGAVLDNLQTYTRTFEETAKRYGYDLADVYAQNAKEQDATHNAFQTMSEDTASELNGRFTALQISGERAAVAAEGILNHAGTIAADTTAIAVSTAQITSILSQSYVELQGIRQNTGNTAASVEASNAHMARISRHIEEL